ncbi:ribosomal-protein-alanine N-acetyltransferase [archaeon SCG-AAA382B04]|nr:ribosomal-protein-alanine N-acetyltransferase [archaeon SCG-AAA382B04]
MEITNYNPEDLIEILKLESQVFGKNGFNTRHFIYLTKNYEYFYVAKENGEVIGYILGGKINQKEFKLISLAVQPQHQGKKVGTKLLKKFLKNIKKEHPYLISLEVRKSNQKAKKFYKKFGFKEVRKKPDYYQNGEDAILMAKKLD